MDQVTLIPATAPVITVNPINQTNHNGYPAGLQVSATGYPTPAYQWFNLQDGLIPGATNAVFSPNDSGFAGVAGSYYAVASNIAGTVTSSTATVTYQPSLPPPDWSAAFKSPFNYNDFYYSCMVDASGNLYAAGEFGGTNSLGISAGPGGDAADLVKQAPDSTLQWLVAITNTGEGHAYSVAVSPAPSGGAYLLANLTGTNYLNGAPLVDSGGGSIFLGRFDSNGLPVWTQILGKTGSSFALLNCLVSDPNGNATLSALFSGPVNLDGSNIALSGQVGILLQFDLNGNLKWIQTNAGGFFQYLVQAGGVIYGSLGTGASSNVFARRHKRHRPAMDVAGVECG